MVPAAADVFEAVEQSLRSGGPDAVFELLVRNARERGNHRELFSIRLMQIRHRLGLPLVETEGANPFSGEERDAFEAGIREAAQETGGLFLADGDIASAYPYFRAIGDLAPVAAAIEGVKAGDSDAAREKLDQVIGIAFQEEVNQRKGFELILEHHGICRAITCFGGVRDSGSRAQCLQLLVRTLYAELLESLKRTIAANEEAAPATGSVAELIAGRDWLFEGNSYYVDSSHLISLLRYSPELEDPALLRMALEMADYGQRLAPMYHFRGDPPFDDPYADHAVYLRVLLGEDVEAGIAHFRAKGDDAAEVLIDLLVRLDRYQEAIGASLGLAPDRQSGPMQCPSVLQLCQMAGDYERLRAVARERGDVVSFAAGVVQGES